MLFFFRAALPRCTLALQGMPLEHRGQAAIIFIIVIVIKITIIIIIIGLPGCGSKRRRR